MLLIQLLARVTLLAACSFMPGFLFVRRLRLTPLEKLSCSVALSLILLYLAGSVIYWFGPEDPPSAFAIVVLLILSGLLYPAIDSELCLDSSSCQALRG